MALQMTGSAPEVLLGPCDAASLHPDLQWLQQQLAGPKPPKMVVLVNPCNPTGGYLVEKNAVVACKRTLL
jgi:aspartate/methionine/tyrosine aminotransferase